MNRFSKKLRRGNGGALLPSPPAFLLFPGCDLEKSGEVFWRREIKLFRIRDSTVKHVHFPSEKERKQCFAVARLLALWVSRSGGLEADSFSN